MQATRFDAVVIGSGPAGGAAAAALARGGLQVAMVDAGPYGGTCPLTGCEPKKVLWQAAEVVARAEFQAKGGVAGVPTLDWPALMAFKRTFTAAVPPRAEAWYRKLGIETLHGKARFVGPDAVAVGDAVLTADHFVVAVGARPADLDFEGRELVASSDVFLDLDALPRHLAFIGGGFISMEFAHIAARAGCRCIVVQRGPRILRGFDPDMAALALQAARDRGIRVELDCPVTAVRREGQTLAIHVRQGRDKLCGCDMVVHGAGRVPALEGLDLQAAGVALDRGRVAVDGFLRSPSNPRVYAAGDCAATPFALTPTADMEGKVAAANILHGNTARPDYRGVGRVVFTFPPLAAVGLTQEEAAAQGLDVEVHHHDMAPWASARRVGLAHAACKVLVDRASGLVVGGHVLGHHAEEAINALGLAIRHGIPAAELRAFAFAYPSSTYEVRHML